MTAAQRVVSVVGLPATGKSWLALRLSTALDVACWSIDEERRLLGGEGYYWFGRDDQAWSNLADRIRSNGGPCILETSGTSYFYPLVVEGLRLLTIECVATDEVRRARLAQRVADGVTAQPQYVQRLLGFKVRPTSVDVAVDTLDLEDRAAALEVARHFVS